MCVCVYRTIVLDHVSSDSRLSEIQDMVNDKVSVLISDACRRGKVVVCWRSEVQQDMTARKFAHDFYASLNQQEQGRDYARAFRLARGCLRYGPRDLVDESLTLGACGVKKEATLVKMCGYRLRGGAGEGGGAAGSAMEQIPNSQPAETAAVASGGPVEAPAPVGQVEAAAVAPAPPGTCVACALA